MQSSVPPNLPVGWRFHPTHFELLDHYLRSKRLGLPIDYFHIKEIPLYNFNPRDLPDSPDKEWYFFCRPEIYIENGRTKRKRKARDGFWKCTGQTISVTPEDSNEKIGTRKILVYHDPNPTKWVIHEYEYTAKLNLPVKGDFVLCKLKNKAYKKSKKVEPNPKKNKTNNESNKITSSSTKNTKPNKKARKDLSICNADAAAAIENQNVQVMMTNSSYGEGEQCNHMVSVFKTHKNQNLNDKTTIPPYKTGESSYQNLSDSEYQNSSHFEYHQDVSDPQFTPNISNLQFIPNISNPQNSSHFEYHQDVSYPQFTPNISNPRFTPYISNPQKSCHFEYHQNVSDPRFTSNISNLKFIQNISNPQFSQDVYNYLVLNSLSESQFSINSLSENQTPTEMTYDSSYQKNKPNYLVNLDSDHQNISNNTYSLAFVECQWSPLNKMPSNFENQNQHEKTIDIQETTFQDLESQHEKTDMTVLEDYQNSFSEQQLAELMDELDDNLSSPPE